MFQSTLPHGERQSTMALHSDVIRFQSTLPHGERQLYVLRSFRTQPVFQSTLPHGERPASRHVTSSADQVSIHAPARGATGCDGMPARSDAVSIHAPARGATHKHRISCQRYHAFQSTLPHGERHMTSLCTYVYGLMFQSTLPHGERLSHVWRRVAIINRFNPRSRTGSDRPCRSGSSGVHRVSIHAPARGATAVCVEYRLLIMFQSTLPHGERHREPLSQILHIRVSIHAPARGATDRVNSALQRDQCFNPRSRTGSDIVEADLMMHVTWFQSTLPHGERPAEI